MTWTLKENIDWVNSLPHEQGMNAWKIIGEAYESDMPENQINEMISRVRIQTQPATPTLKDKLLGAGVLVMMLVGANDLVNTLIDLPGAVKNMKNK